MGGGPMGGAPSVAGGASGTGQAGADGGAGSGGNGGGGGGGRAAGGAGGTAGKPAAPRPASFKAVVDHWVQPIGGARVAADFNGDGRPDIAFINNWGSGVLVRLGQGDGSFRKIGDDPLPEPRMEDPDVGIATDMLIAADLNGDGRVDLVASDTSGHDVSVRFGNGDGSFAPDSRYPVGSIPSQILLADLTGDGSLDLVVVRLDPTDTTRSRSELVLLVNQGKGTFAPFVPLNVGSKISVQSAAAADLDGDGSVDLVLGGRDSTRPTGIGVIIVWINQGAPRFAAPREYTVNRTADAPVFAVGDIDGDHLLDVVAADNANVTILLGAAGGTLKVGSASPLSDWEGLRGVWFEPVLLDLDADGHLDLLLFDGFADDVSIQLGDGKGRFDPSRIFGIRWSESTRHVAFADFDGDGLVDVDGVDGVSKNAGAGALLPPAAPSFADYSVPVDLDGDSRVDVVKAFYDPLSIGLRKSDGSFDPPAALPDGVNTVLGAADLDGDGRTDLLVNSLPPALPYVPSILLNQGAGRFAAPVAYPLNPGFRLENNLGFSLARIRDLDGDGKPDVVLLNAASGTVSVLLNDGRGGLGPESVFPIELAHTRDYSSGDLAIADFDGDGASDLVVTYQPVGAVVLLHNTGRGRFDPPRQLLAQPVDSFSRSLWLQPVAGADLDGDGRPEIVVAGDREVGTDERRGRLTVFRNLGGGNFGAPEDYAIGPHPASIAFGDLNDDGKTDIVAATSGSGSASSDYSIGTNISILFGYGDGTFLPSVDYPLGVGTDEWPGRPAILDYRGDSRPEIVLASGAAVFVLYRDK
jgi:hypothetical protein